MNRPWRPAVQSIKGKAAAPHDAAALGCEALGAAVEGADCRALVSRTLDLGIGAVIVGRAWGKVAESFAEGFSGGAAIADANAADIATCQRTRTGSELKTGLGYHSYS